MLEIKRNRQRIMTKMIVISMLFLCSACANTPSLHWAKTESELRKRLDSGESATIPDKWGGTPLHYISLSHNLESIKMASVLIDHGADINARDNDGDTPLLWASKSEEHERIHMMKFLLDHGAKVNVANKDGYTPLLNVSKSLDSERVNEMQLLLDHGAVVNVADKDGYTPLHEAANVCHLLTKIDMNQQLEMVRLLIQRGANINAKDNLGQTPLHYAFGANPVSRELLNSGADVHLINNNKQSPPEYSYQKNYLGPQKPVAEVAFIETYGVRENLLNKFEPKLDQNQRVIDMSAVSINFPIISVKSVSRKDTLTIDEQQPSTALRYSSSRNNENSLYRNNYGGLQLLPGKYEITMKIFFFSSNGVLAGNASISGLTPGVKSIIDVKAGAHYELAIDDKGVLFIQDKPLQFSLF